MRKHEIARPIDWSSGRSPLREFKGMRRMMEGVLEEFFGEERTGLLEKTLGQAWMPPVDVQETEKHYVFSAELPGIEKGDFKVETVGRSLVISGEKKTEKEEKSKHYLRHEQTAGSFRRVFSLPEDALADEIKASHKNGILKIEVPRSEKARPKGVSIEVE